ncbi:MAG: PhnD/SsuA/transferrin family substrate-binding protein [Pseudomonadota bacterium]
MIAHLPMYDTPENRAAHGRLWDGFYAALGLDGMPSRPGANLWADWRSPNLLLSQTCGLPYRAELHRQVQLVATPDNHLPGCPPGHYRSAIIARVGSDPDLAANDFTLAYNEPLSQSGWGAPWAEGITGAQRIQTGGHAISAEAVRASRADVAAIDALTWHFLQRDWDGADQLRVIRWTQPTPTLPYITSVDHDVLPIRDALAHAIAGLSDADQNQLHLYGLVDILADVYLSHPIPPAP